MDQNKLKAYAATFTAYLLMKLGDEIEYIDRIILYGSVAKGEATKESDVDIFIDTKKPLKDVKIILEQFYKSREAAIFKLEGIENKINIKVGKLSEWKELHRSISASGIVLWDKFEEKKKPLSSKHHIIFFWSKVGKNRGAFLNKMYGFNVRKKHYMGLLEKWGGKKIGKSSVLVPVRYKDEMIILIKEYNVDAKNIDVFI